MRQITVYKYDELSDAAKLIARGWYLHYHADNWALSDNAIAVGLMIIDEGHEFFSNGRHYDRTTA